MTKAGSVPTGAALLCADNRAASDARQGLGAGGGGESRPWRRFPAVPWLRQPVLGRYDGGTTGQAISAARVRPRGVAAGERGRAGRRRSLSSERTEPAAPRANG